MLPTKAPVTADELLQMSRAAGKRYELIHGELRTMAPAGYQHGKVASAINALIRDYVTAHQLGDVVAAETGFLLSRNPDHVRAPDFAFVAAGRVPPGPGPIGYPELAPDFVAEVVSPGDSASEVQERVDDWLRAGTRIVWVVYPTLRRVVVWRGPGLAELRGADEEVDAEPVIPGLRVRVANFLP